ncbi:MULTISPECIES: tyrosine-type recombinase/integrase [Mesorhizobium]|uniref:tyrosine-type recombinase/integrase n=1 Tax=Mesorhizobium TaxID=68287 RepID=UPI001FDA545A|nr:MULTISPECIES: tyrosine-type recombinase/integrase [Mesorhizobium]WJI38351.1 tyrosine-type recombinase/integrase [Mesorhizobium opportunistum]
MGLSGILATGVNANDVQLERPHPQVLLRGKGRRDRVIPIPKDLARSLTTLLSERGIAHHEPRPIFVGARNERLTHFGATHIVRRAAAEAVAIRPALADNPISPHIFRHYLPRPTMSGSYDRKCKHLRTWRFPAETPEPPDIACPIYRLFKNPNKLSSGR